MINILLEGYDIDAAWLYEGLQKYIKSNSKVVVIAFSFRGNRVRSVEDWNLFYSKENGKYYGGITGGFSPFGIPESNITFLNYFTDTKETAMEKVKQADILYYLGGLPDQMMDRIMEFDLYDMLLHHQGIVMGYSAGAVIQLAEYHLSPDDDYAEFGYYKGIPYLSDFYLEVHYQGTDIQNRAITRVLKERSKPVYAMHRGHGAIIVENGILHTLGEVKVFQPSET